MQIPLILCLVVVGVILHYVDSFSTPQSVLSAKKVLVQSHKSTLQKLSTNFQFNNHNFGRQSMKTFAGMNSLYQAAPKTSALTIKALELWDLGEKWDRDLKFSCAIMATLFFFFLIYTKFYVVFNQLYFKLNPSARKTAKTSFLTLECEKCGTQMKTLRANVYWVFANPKCRCTKCGAGKECMFDIENMSDIRAQVRAKRKEKEKAEGFDFADY